MKKFMILSKRRKDRIDLVVTIAIFIAVALALCYIFQVGYYKEKGNFLIYFSILAIFCLVPLGFDLHRSVCKARTFKLELDGDTIYLDGRTLCSLKSLEYVFLQPVVGWKGFGVTYTVGIRYSDRHASLLYDLKAADAGIEANKIASFLNIPVEKSRKKLFTLYRGY